MVSKACRIPNIVSLFELKNFFPDRNKCIQELR